MDQVVNVQRSIAFPLQFIRGYLIGVELFLYVFMPIFKIIIGLVGSGDVCPAEPFLLQYLGIHGFITTAKTTYLISELGVNQFTSSNRVCAINVIADLTLYIWFIWSVRSIFMVTPMFFSPKLLGYCNMYLYEFVVKDVQMYALYQTLTLLFRFGFIEIILSWIIRLI